jgi:hypothetical protein
MSPASYQTAPPRAGILAATPKPRQYGFGFKRQRVAPTQARFAPEVMGLRTRSSPRHFSDFFLTQASVTMRAL